MPTSSAWASTAKPAWRAPGSCGDSLEGLIESADAALYDGFPSDADKRLFPRVRSAAVSDLAGFGPRFDDPRFAELLFRYRARNWPASLDTAERQRWDEYRRLRLGSDRGLSEYDFTSYYAEIATLRASTEAGPRQAWLDALEAWGHDLERDLA